MGEEQTARENELGIWATRPGIGGRASGWANRRQTFRTGIYGTNPYERYDSQRQPFLYRGELPENVPAMSRVVTVGDRAWALDLVREKKRIETPDGLVITWRPAQASALDQAEIAESKDVGTVVVQKQTEKGLEDVAYGVDFAFAFKAFHPDSAIITEAPQES